MVSGPEEKAQTTLNYLGVQVLELIFFFFIKLLNNLSKYTSTGLWLEITGIK